jgi:hypothetical protein
MRYDKGNSLDEVDARQAAAIGACAWTARFSRLAL